MLEIKQEDLTTSLLRRFVPSHRFVPIQVATINRSYSLQAPLNSDSIKVLNWNIAKKNYEKNWTKDFTEIINQHHPDIIFLQEVRMDTRVEQAIGLAEMSWSFAPNFMDTHHNTYFGLLTAAKTTSINSQALLTQHYEPFLRTPKVSLITEYFISGLPEKLLAVNSHLINFVDLNKFKTQLHELEYVLSKHRGPIIFSGDFNTWNSARAMLLSSVIARLGLTTVSFSASDSRNIKRFLLSPPLDHIFYRGLNQTKRNTKVLDHISSSDHKPLITEFSC
ncbi:MAG TPA: endonuclease/exonuclease/phosphatase family protein [Crinalium sp.]|jgi:endonuclease/exonuclease/phosphatase (EEP) superfamily protein YafD